MSGPDKGVGRVPWAGAGWGGYLRVAGVGLALLLALALLLPVTAAPELKDADLPFTRQATKEALGDFSGQANLFDNSAEVPFHLGKQLVLPGERPRLKAYRIQGSFRRAADRAVRIYFAAGQGKRYLLCYSAALAKDNGLFVEQGERRERWFDTSALVAGSKGALYLKLGLKVRDGQVTVTVNGKSLGTRMPDQASTFQLAVAPHGPSIRLILDELRVLDLSGASPRVVAEADFAELPLLADMAHATGLDPNSRAYRALSCLLLLALALLLDLLLLLLRAHLPLARWCTLTPAGMLYILMPLQAAMLMAARAMLRLPYSALLLFLLVLAALKTLALLRAGFGRVPLSAPPLALPAALMVVGLGLHLGLLQLFRSSSGDPSPALHSFLPFILWAPLLSLPLSRLLGRHQPPGAFLLAVAQFGLAWIVPRAEAPLLLFAVAPMMLWQLAAAAQVLRRPRFRFGLRALYAAAALVMIFGLLELGLRAQPTLNRELVPKMQFFGNTWKLSEHTNLFGDKERADSFECNGRRHKRAKPPGVLRVICLGSSSTAGDGAENPDSTYPSLLEPMLRKLTGREVEVINGGINGGSFFQIRVYLEDVLLRMDPDLVVVYFGYNGDFVMVRDLYMKMKAMTRSAPHLRDERQLWAAMQLRYHPPWLVDLFLRAVQYRSFIGLREGLVRISGRKEKPKPRQAGPPTHLLDPTQSPTECVELCAQRMVPLVLIPEVMRSEVLSREDEATPDPEGAYHKIFKNMVKESGVKALHYVSLAERYNAKLVYSYFHDEVHMSGAGYKYLARNIADAIMARGLLPSAAKPRPAVEQAAP